MTLSVSFDRSSLSLATLEVTGVAPASGMWVSEVTRPGERWRRNLATSPFVHGGVQTHATIDQSEIVVTLHATAATSADLTAFRASVKAAAQQFYFLITVTEDGETSTYECDCADLTWNPYAGSMANAYVTTATITIPCYPVAGGRPIADDLPGEPEEEGGDDGDGGDPDPEDPEEPGEDPTEGEGLIGLGVYDDTYAWGTTPRSTNTYYQPAQRISQSKERARMTKNCSPNITITTKGTQRIADGAAMDSGVLAWMDQYIADAISLAKFKPTVPVFITIEHEMKSKVAQGDVTGDSADPTTYGEFLSVFFARVNAAKTANSCTNLFTTWWIVAYDRTFENATGAALTVDPDVMVFDPYAHSGSTQTIADIVDADLDWYLSRSWYNGQPFGLGEFGMKVAYGDPALKTFYTNVATKFAAVEADKGVTFLFANLFNRTRDDNHAITTPPATGSFPLAVNAYRASMAASSFLTTAYVLEAVG